MFMNYGFCNSNFNSQQRGTIKVNGSATVKAEPDKAIVSIGVITEDLSLEKAQRENSTKVNAIIMGLYAASIPKKDITTSIYDIQPQYDFVDGKQEFRGYRVANILAVSIRNLSKVGEIIDKAVANGANRVDNIAFTIENSASYYNRALELAVKDTIEKAKEIGYNYGVQVNPVPFSVVEQSFSSVTEDRLTMKLAASATPIMPGQIDIVVRIEAIFQYNY